MHADDPRADWLANAYGGLSRREFLTKSAAGVALAGFAVAATPVAGEVVRTSADALVTADLAVPSRGYPVPAYVARPARAGRSPIVLVVPEVFGMHEHLKDVTRRFAREGYFALTFEPYAREGGTAHLPDQPSVMKVANTAPDDRVLADLDALAAYARQQPEARADRLGVTGFCRGGMYALLYAAHAGPGVQAAVPWYGQLRPAMTPGVRTKGPFDVVSKIQAPVLGLYGGADLGIPAADVKALEAALKAAGKTAEFVLYPDAPHAFFADYRPSYRAEAAADAWKRCLAWFARYLKA